MASDSDMNDAMAGLEADLGMSELTSSAIGMHQMYLDFVKAGFTTRQALYLVAFALNASGARPPGADDTDPEPT